MTSIRTSKPGSVAGAVARSPRPRKGNAAALARSAYFMSHDEIARELGVTRELVSQIERAAMQKLRVACQERGILPRLIFEELA